MKSTAQNKKAGFTLIELTMVVAILATLASFAIPSLLNARKPANEASAISTLRSILTVNEQYRLRFHDYASSLADLEANNYIDQKLGSGTKAGFAFGYTPAASSWSCTADPEVPGQTGDRYFFIDQGGVIRASTTGTATSLDAPLN